MLKATVAATVFSFGTVFFLALSSQQLDRSDFNCDSSSSVLPTSDSAVDPITKQLLSLTGRREGGRKGGMSYKLLLKWEQFYQSWLLGVERHLKKNKINTEGFL